MVHAPPPPPLGLPPVRINIYSDTQTLPSAAMKAAMMEAKLGDEQSGTDPTINLLCERMATLMNKPAAMFLPTGTMCNQISILTHCRPGDEILAHETAHILTAEGGGAAALAGAQITPLQGPRGMFDLATLQAAIRPKSRNHPPQALLSLEQTTNIGGGAVWDLKTLNALTDFAHEAGLTTHMDGARMMNAVVASGVAAADFAAGSDSVWLDFTKGLGAPLGAVLCGSKEFIGQAWRWKQRVGGAMRQGGICAAACLYALDHNVDRLAEDHANARTLARGLAQIPGLTVEDPETNLVFFDTSGTGMTADCLAQLARKLGVSFTTMGPYCGRACTHLDVTTAHIEEAIAVIGQVAAEGLSVANG